MFRWRRLAASVYSKIVIGTLISAVGIAGGIYVGYGWTYGRQEFATKQPLFENSVSGPYVKFAPGDAFPLEQYVDYQGQSGSFEDLLKDKESLVIFADWGCDGCLDLLRFTQTTLLQRLKRGVQVVVLAEQESAPILAEYAGLIKGTIPLKIDGAYWRATYHTIVWPTIVGVDNSGIIQHVQIGYSGFIDHELVELFFSTAR